MVLNLSGVMFFYVLTQLLVVGAHGASQLTLTATPDKVAPCQTTPLKLRCSLAAAQTVVGKRGTSQGGDVSMVLSVFISSVSKGNQTIASVSTVTAGAARAEVA